ILVCMGWEVSAQQSFLDRLRGRNAEQQEEAEADSLVKERKPLESYFFDDSLRNRLIFSWKTRMGFNQVDTIAVDTMLYRFEIDYPFQQHGVGSIYLGNLGGASQRISYFEQAHYRNFHFLEAYDDYLLSPDRAPFFNVKRPFTNLTYFTAGQARYMEQHLEVTHAQNISPSTGFNIHYLNRNTKGTYHSQWAKDKNLSLAFSHTGKRYSVHAGYVYNMGDINENGGLAWDGQLGDQSIDLTENIDVRMQNFSTLNEFKTNTFYINQAYGIPLQRVTDIDLSIADKSSIFIGHAFEYTTAYRKYQDNYADTSFDLGDPGLTDENDNPILWPDDPRAAHEVNYYPHWYYNPQYSLDSLREHRLDNKLYVQIQPWDRDGVIGTIDGGIGQTFYHYENFIPQDYILSRKRDSKNDTYLYGGVHGKLRRYIDWKGNIEYHLAGFRSQDIKLGGSLSMSAYIRRRPVTLTVAASVEDRSPAYWMQYYRSNHYIWDKDFSKENEIRLQAALRVPSLDLEIGVWNSTTTDKLYYGYEQGTKRTATGTYTAPDGTEGIILEEVPVFDVAPLQFNGTVSVTGVYVEKNFKAGILRLNNRVLFQQSSHEQVVAVPQISAQASWYADFSLVRNVLHMQIGLSGFYHTKYYAPGYNPALMQFHAQNFAGAAYSEGLSNEELLTDIEAPKKIGGYPYMDFFVAAKWKRMRILAKFQHVNQDLFESASYFSALHYPLNRRVMKLGVSWSFYD
ncbi:MAG: putative porin, partial [Rikenellaceae bacterium]|nr:putative porin [Rikenellaceae bacterium]